MLDNDCNLIFPLEDCVSSGSLEQRAKVFAALADPTRLRIVEILAQRDTEIAGSEIATQAGISLALFCHHSKTLAEAGVIKTRKEGQTKYHRLNVQFLMRCFQAVTENS